MAGGNNNGGKGGGNMNPLLNPSAQLSGNALQQAAQALTNAQVTGPITELGRQIGLNNRQGRGAERLTARYFRNLGQYSKYGIGQERQYGNQLNQQLQNINQQTQNQMSQAGAGQLGQSGLMGLQSSGLGGGQMQALAAELARQRGLQAQDSGVFRSAGATQGANYGQLASSNLQSYALGGQQRLGEIAQATRLADEPLLAKIANLRASQGALLASNEGKLRQQEIANAFTAKGLNLKGQALKNAFTLGQQANGIRAAAVAKSGSGGGSSHGHSGGSSSSGSGGLTPTQKAEIAQDVSEVKSTVSALRNLYPGITTAQIRQVLTTGQFRTKQGTFPFQRADGGGYGSIANQGINQAFGLSPGIGNFPH